MPHVDLDREPFPWLGFIVIFGCIGFLVWLIL